MATHRLTVGTPATSETGDRSVTFTPAAGDLPVVFIDVAANTNGAPTCSDDNPDGLGTYTLIAVAQKAAGADREAAFVRDALINNTTSTVITVATGSNTSGIPAVVAVAGMTRVGAAAIRQSAKEENITAGNTPTSSFPAAVLTGNLTLGAVGNQSNPAAQTAPTGWTERFDDGIGTPNIGLEVVTRDSGFTGTAITWNSTSSAHATIIVELDASSTGQVISVGQVTETDLAQAVTRIKVRSTGQVTEADTAQAVARLKARAVGQVGETDVAQALTVVKVAIVAQAVEVDLAQAITFSGVLVIPVGQALEADVTQAIAWAPKLRLVGLVSEVDLAQAMSRRKTLGIAQAIESDLAVALGRLKTVTVAQLLELDLAQPIVAIGGAGLTIPLVTGYLIELDTLVRPQQWQPAAGIFADSTSVFADSTLVTAAASTGTFLAQLDKTISVVSAVTQDGAALVAVASAAACVAMAGSWYWDGIAHALWVRTSDDAAAVGKVIVATVVECFALGDVPGPILRGTIPVVYDPIVTALPKWSVTLNLQDLGSAAAVTLGTLEALNGDGWFDRLLAERSCSGQAVRIYRGELSGADRADLALWATAAVETLELDPERAMVQLRSLAHQLEQPICPDTYELADFPNLLPNAVGQPIPKVYGSVVRAPALCVDTVAGVWRLAGHPLASLTSLWLSSGGEYLLGYTPDPDNGGFTAPSSSKFSIIYATFEGKPVSLPGDVMRQIALDGGLTEAQLDGPAFDRLNVDRPVPVGLTVTGGTVGEALSRVAASVFADRFITRANTLSVRARSALSGNLVTNPGFETDTAGWATRNNATLSRITSQAAVGVACGQIVKGAPDPLAYAYTPVAVPQGQRVVVTCLAAPLSGVAEQVRLALADWTGTERLSDPFVLAPGVWTRLVFAIDASLMTLQSITADRTDVFADDTSVTADLGAPELRIYPDHGGALAVTIIVDEVEVVPAVLADGSNARVTGLATEPLLLSRVTCRYAHDLLTDTGARAIVASARAAALYASAESRSVDGELVDAAGALAVGAAVLDFYGRVRAVTRLELLDWDRPLTVGDVIDCGAVPRVPALALGSGLGRVIALEEAPGGGQSPVIRADVAMVFDPASGARVLN